MLDELEPAVILIFGAAILSNAIILGGLITLFQPGERGYFARHGQFDGWALCIGVSFVLNVIAINPYRSLCPSHFGGSSR